MDDQMYVAIYLSLSMGIIMYFCSLREYIIAVLLNIAYLLLPIMFFASSEQLSGLEIENFEYIKLTMALSPLTPFVLLFLIVSLLKILFLYEKYQADIVRKIFRRG
jgi:hypothetical protein